jgi:hypothetical protein
MIKNKLFVIQFLLLSISCSSIKYDTKLEMKEYKDWKRIVNVEIDIEVSNCTDCDIKWIGERTKELITTINLENNKKYWTV